jgi:hypothetical protein
MNFLAIAKLFSLVLMALADGKIDRNEANTIFNAILDLSGVKK